MKKTLTFISQSFLVQTLAVMGLLSVFGVAQAYTQSAVLDPDIWWHVRTGQWIIHHHAVPRVGLFSQIGLTLPWAAYSWGFETVVGALNIWLSLKGLTIYVMAFGVIFTLLHFTVLRSVSRTFWLAWLLTALTLWAMNPGPIAVPRPVTFSILFFTLEMGLVFKALQTGDRRFLYWLPLLFLFWANFHIQFVYGLLIPGLMAFVATVERWARTRQISWLPQSEEFERLNPITLWGVLTACLAATLINPYGFGLYKTIFIYARSSYPYHVITELQAMNFRQSANYIEVLLAAAGFYLLGRRKPNLFQLTLLVIAFLVAFRTQRDAWFLCIIVSGIIAYRPRSEEEAVVAENVPPRSIAALRLGLAVVGAICIMTWQAKNSGLRNDVLLKTVRNSYPVDAVVYIQQHQPAGPLYNNFNWGGFLVGVLPEYPVSIDGRNDLYGDVLLYRAMSTLLAVGWKDDPIMARANLILLPRDLPVCGELSRSPQFELAYSDKMSMVFVRKQQSATLQH